MTEIDVTKPLELTDGTPVVLKSSGYNEIHVAVPVGHAAAGGRTFRSNGTRPSYITRFTAIRLRNKAEGFTAGQTVYFRDGRKGVVVDFPESFGGKYVRAAVLGHIYLTAFTAVLAYQNGLQSADGSHESYNDFAAEPFAPKPAFTFRNVYADGTAGSTPHRTLDVAKLAAKVGKTRIGILKVGTDGSTELLKCKPSVRTSGRLPAEWTDA